MNDTFQMYLFKCYYLGGHALVIGVKAETYEEASGVIYNRFMAFITTRIDYVGRVELKTEDIK